MAKNYITREVTEDEINDSDLTSAIEASWPKMKSTIDYTSIAPTHLVGSDSDHTNKNVLEHLIRRGGTRGERILVVEDANDNDRQLSFQTAYIDDDNSYTIDFYIAGPDGNGSRAWTKTDVPAIRQSFRAMLNTQSIDKFAVTISGGIKNHFDEFYAGESNDADNGVRDTVGEGNANIDLYKMRIPSE